jgi:VCBS repeat-containing protein
VNGSAAALGTSITLRSGATLTVHADSTFTYVPAQCFSGGDSFTFTAGDGTLSTTTTASIYVRPLVNNWSTGIYAGQFLNVDRSWGLLECAATWPMNVTAVDGCPTDVSRPVTLPSGATLTVNGDGSLRYAPAEGFTGDDAFTFTVSDGPTSGTATATIVVMPTFYLYGPSSLTTYTDTPLTRLAGDGLLASSYDVDGRTPAIVAVDGCSADVGEKAGLPSGATVTVNANGSFVYSPPGRFHGVDSFTITASDGLTDVTVTVSICVQQPVLNLKDASYSISANHALTVGASDGLVPYTYDLVGDTLNVAAINGNPANVGVPITLPSRATLTVNADGTFTYVPAAGYTGNDGFTYTITDGLVSAVSTANIKVVAPFIHLRDSFYTTAVGKRLVVGSNGLFAEADLSPGMALTVKMVNGTAADVGTPITLPSGATLTVNAEGSFTYVPVAGYIGNDSFTFTASDGPTASSATVTLTVTFFTNTSFSTWQREILSLSAASGLLANDGSSVHITAVNGSAAAVGIATPLPSGATLTVNADGSFTYVPPVPTYISLGFVGNDSFTATASDGNASATASITINVIQPVEIWCDSVAVEHCEIGACIAIWPVIYDGNFGSSAAQSTAFMATAGDTLRVDATAGLLANDASSAQVAAVNGRVYNVGVPITLPSGATLTVRPDGSFAYTPADGYAGQDQFSFTVGENGYFSTATVSIEVNATSWHISNALFTTGAGQSLTKTAPNGLLASLNPVSGTTIAITAVNGIKGDVGAPITLASGATLTVFRDGSFTYIPAAGFKGRDHFLFTASNGVTSASATVSINVLAPVPAPTVHDLSYQSTPLGTLEMDASNGLLTNEPQPFSSTLKVTEVNGNPAIIGAPLILASGATLTVNADGSFTYAPASSFPPPNFFRQPPQPDDSDSFTVTMSDGVKTFSVRVTIVLEGANIEPLEPKYDPM